MDLEKQSVLLPVEIANRIRIILHHEPYKDVADILDELNYSIGHPINNNLLVD